MKLWQKSHTITTKAIEKFTVGNDSSLDLHLAPYDILGSFAHSLMLQKIKIISAQEMTLLKKEFSFLYQLAIAQKFVIDPNVEDVHSQVELLLTKQLGDLGKKIHTARSRNDQVLVDLKLYALAQFERIVEQSNELFLVLIQKSEQYKHVLMPGYTHFQVAMPSSFGLWFGAYAESLTDDMHTVLAAFKVCNQNPLGSGAGFGSSFPIDRTLTSKLLGFDDLSYNVVYAQMTRGKFEKISVQALSNIAATLNKFASDVCLYINENHRFVTLPHELTTGSSIMPHKKNPDAFELIRAHTNKISSIANELSMLTHNLPSGYHRDLQLTKSCLIEAFSHLQNCLDICILLVKELRINKDILLQENYQYLFTVEEVNALVMQGMAFRDAYQKIGKDVEQGVFKSKREIKHTHEGSIGNLCNQKIKEKMTAILQEFHFKKMARQRKKLIAMMQE